MNQNQSLKLPKHITDVQIRFNDIDGLGHVNNSVYAQYFDMGRQSYFESLNEGPINWKEAGLVIASTHTEFLFPIFLRDEISVASSVSKIGNKSLKMIQVIFDRKTKEPKATCKSVMVGFDPASNASMLIPDFWRNRIAAFED